MSEKWHLEDSAGDDPEIRLSTIELSFPHGKSCNLHYESCAFWNGGSRVIERYETQSEAAKGHERLLSLIQSGDYHVPDGETLKRSDQTE